MKKLEIDQSRPYGKTNLGWVKREQQNFDSACLLHPARTHSIYDWNTWTFFWMRDKPDTQWGNNRHVSNDRIRCGSENKQWRKILNEKWEYVPLLQKCELLVNLCHIRTFTFCMICHRTIIQPAKFYHK